MKSINLILVFIYFIIIDYPLIGYINKKMYQDNFKKITKEEMKFNITAAILCYMVMSISLNYFVIDKYNISSPTSNIIVDSSILGFSLYGVYNLTNQATLNHYSTIVTIKDTIWGSILLPIVSYLIIKVFPKSN